MRSSDSSQASGSGATGTCTNPSGSSDGLFTDIVDSTAKAAALGDRAWRDLIQRHHAAIRRHLARFRVRELDTAGAGFFASFDGPARAIHCACAIGEAVKELGLGLRAGLHTGECEVVDGKVGGIAVHIGARIAAQAEPGEVLVSSTVKDLVAGSGIRFVERGVADLKGVPGVAAPVPCGRLRRPNAALHRPTFALVLSGIDVVLGGADRRGS